MERVARSPQAIRRQVGLSRSAGTLASSVTTIDWLIVALTALLAAVGFRQGFILGALSLAGFAAGAFLGARLAPALLPDGASSPYAPVLALGGGVLAGTILSFGLQALGVALRAHLTLPGLGILDGLLGAVLSAALGLGIAWVVGAVALQTPGARALRADIQRSVILRRLNDVLPPSGPILNALARFDPVPSLEGPRADVSPPRAAVARDPDVRAAGHSTVKVLGTACGLGIEGSGWVAGPGVVVTNAHVVAGQDDTTVQLEGTGDKLQARALVFDPTDDVAVLAVGGLGATALSLVGDPSSGTPGAILGYPLDGPFDVRAARLGGTRTVLSEDAYGRGPVRREITSFRGKVRSGNSGGPVVDDRGRVLTTVFAATRGGEPGGYGVPNDRVRSALREAAAGRTASTGPCAR